MKTMRIWFGCVAGMAVTLFFDWSYGLFAVLLPIVLLMRMDSWNTKMVMNAVIGIAWASIQVCFILSFLQAYPVLMFLAVGFMVLEKCIAVLNPQTNLYGFIGLICSSLMLNLGSYQNFDLEELTIVVWMSAVMSIGLIALALFLFPEPTVNIKKHHSLPPQPEFKASSLAQKKIQSIEKVKKLILGWSVIMIGFVVFQVADLNDSMPAQMAIIIVGSSMTMTGAVMGGKVHIIGCLLGALAGCSIQILLYSLSYNPVLLLLGFAIASGVFMPWLASPTFNARIGFSAMTLLVVPLTTTLVPEQRDVLTTFIYSFCCVIVSVGITLLLVWFISSMLERLLPTVKDAKVIT